MNDLLRAADYHLVMDCIERNKDMEIKGRANTDEEKEVIMARILFAWKQVPSLRLGQFIVNTVGTDPFYVEDDVLVKAMEAYVS